MATPTLVTVRDFSNYRYAQVSENTDGNPVDILARAEARIQQYVGRKLTFGTYSYKGRPSSQSVILKEYPVKDILVARRRFQPYSNWVNLSVLGTSIWSETGVVEFADPIIGYEVEITYRAGYEIVPEDIKEAVLLQAVLYSTTDLEVYGTGDSKAPGYISHIRRDIEELLWPYKTTKNIW